jgi:uncharacterized protein involved in exopolysaccharide biosynthesis/Mrp family chromosome partitioning ATPase
LSDTAGTIAPPPTGGEPLATRGVKPLVSLRDHGRLALVVFVAGFVLAFPIAFLKGAPLYQAEAAVHVAPRYAPNLSTDQELKLDSDTQYRSFVQQQVVTITRYDVVLAALASLGDQRALWQKPEEPEQRAVERLAAALNVRAVPETYLVTISLEGRDPEELAPIVNAVAKAYVTQAREEALPGRDRRIVSLRERRAEIVAELDEKVKRATALSAELGVASFSADVANPYDRALAEANEALLVARRDRVQAEAKLAALDESQKRESEIDLSAAADEIAGGDVGLTDLKRLLGQRRTELLVLSSGLAETHPGRRAAAREIGDIDARIAIADRERRQEILKTLKDRRTEKAQEERSRAVAAVEQAKRSETGLEQELEKLHQRLAWFTQNYAEGITITAQVASSREQLRSIDGRVDSLVFEAEAPGFAWIASPARTPDVPQKGGRKKLLGLLLLASAAAALALPVGLDLLDGRIKSANDAERVLGFPPLGWIVSRSELALEEFAADQLRRAALAVERERERTGARLIVLSAVKPGGGATTLALALAREMDGLGVRAVTVEANALHPDPRYAPGREGLVDVLEDRRTASDVVIPGSSTEPDRIALGDTHGARHLDALAKLRQGLEPLWSKYALAFVDAPPLLVSADAELLCSLADVAILVIEAESVQQGELVRARRTLERVGPRCAGAIVNAVRVYRGGGYFSELAKELASGAKVPSDAWWSRWTRP